MFELNRTVLRWGRKAGLSEHSPSSVPPHLVHFVRRLPFQCVIYPLHEGLGRLPVRDCDARLTALPLHHGRPLVHCNTPNMSVQHG